MAAIFRALNTVGKIGLIGGLLGGLAGAVVAIIVSPVFGSIFVAVFIAVFYFAFRTVLAPITRRAALQKSGVQAEATILEVTDTRWTVNEIYPVIKLRLEVRPPNGQPFQAETKEVINRLDIPQFQPGAVIPVIYDPKDPENVSVGAVEGAVTSDNVAQEPERIRQVEEYLAREDRKNQAILASGKPAKAMILNAWDMGILVNGNNPAKTFLLEVRPEGEPSFQAQTVGVISEASIPKFQPGKEIYAKYDPNDKSRVAIDHS